MTFPCGGREAIAVQTGLNRRACWGVLAAVVALVPFAATAHESRDTPSGQYSLEVGFRDEPAYLGRENAVFLKVVQYGTDGGPVEGLAGTLTAEVGKDGQTETFAFVPRQEPGEYEVVFVPTSLGDYTFRITGQIEGETIDETFRSSPDTFASVEPPAALQFPADWPDPTALQSQVEDADSAAAQARNLALAGLVVGAVGLLAGLLALLRSRRAVVAPARTAPEPAAGDEPLVR